MRYITESYDEQTEDEYNLRYIADWISKGYAIYAVWKLFNRTYITYVYSG